MSNYVFVETGQCGNQLGFCLLNSLYDHLVNFDSEQGCLDTFFKPSTGQYTPPNGLPSRGTRSSAPTVTARVVCLDTEPKVINECISRANNSWRIDPRSVAYRHGGAGNNWALGYEMANGEFLETAVEMIRRQLEACDFSSALVFLHSVAGGTGSGLGTHVTEACEDEFPEASRLNIAIAPYHFGEVVVQHYNTALCLSKVAAASHAVMVFENETAQMLCRTMQGIERPTLQQLNSAIVSNLCPVFLPKYSSACALPYTATGARLPLGLVDDVAHLCAHPGYKFVDVKLTPQTSKKSVEFTYDSWHTLLKTLQQMQLSGAPSERSILPSLKHSWQNQFQQQQQQNQQQRSAAFSVDNLRAAMHPSEQPLSSPRGSCFDGATSRVGGSSHPAGRRDCSAAQHLAATAHVKSLASCITLHGPDASEAAEQLVSTCSAAGGNCPSQHTRLTSSGSSGGTAVAGQGQGSHGLYLHEAYWQSHLPAWSCSPGNVCANYDGSSLSENVDTPNRLNCPGLTMGFGAGQGPGPGQGVTLRDSPVAVNGYQRAASVVANSQAVLPLLQRALGGGSELFRSGAYLHQYHTYGIESEDFVTAFRSIGCAVQNYLAL